MTLTKMTPAFLVICLVQIHASYNSREWEFNQGDVVQYKARDPWKLLDGLKGRISHRDVVRDRSGKSTVFYYFHTPTVDFMAKWNEDVIKEGFKVSDGFWEEHKFEAKKLTLIEKAPANFKTTKSKTSSANKKNPVKNTPSKSNRKKKLSIKEVSKEVKAYIMYLKQQWPNLYKGVGKREFMKKWEAHLKKKNLFVADADNLNMMMIIEVYWMKRFPIGYRKEMEEIEKRGQNWQIGDSVCVKNGKGNMYEGCLVKKWSNPEAWKVQFTKSPYKHSDGSTSSQLELVKPSALLPLERNQSTDLRDYWSKVGIEYANRFKKLTKTGAMSEARKYLKTNTKICKNMAIKEFKKAFEKHLKDKKLTANVDEISKYLAFKLRMLKQSIN